MNKILCLAIGLMVFQTMTIFAQPSPPSPGHAVPGAPPPGFQTRLQQIIGPGAAQELPLTRFDLDFKGGTPAELVKAIEKSTGKPLNAIIRPDDAPTQLPPLQMKNVTMPQLFDALEVASERTVKIPAAGVPGALYNNYSTVTLAFGFKTKDSPSDNAIWYFYAIKPPELPSNEVPKVCQYYSLSPFLDRGFTVDDITTAIQAGWKMSGVNPTPELNYHKETQMLIAYGEAGQLKTIQEVLQTLPSANADYWSQTQERIKKMQKQIDLLNQQLATSTPAIGNVVLFNTITNSPAEKSGK